MVPPADPTAARQPGFFDSLPALRHARDTFDAAHFSAAPDDWALAVTDIVDSTGAIAAGRHKTVNFVAAMAIAAAKNLCAPQSIPFLFGGDGAVLMVPPQHLDATRQALARVRGTAAREQGLTLRVGLAPVGDLRRFGCDVRVARFEPTPGNSFGVFNGGGVGVLEDAVRGRAWPQLGALAAVSESLDDGAAADLTGLSCRWAPLQSMRGKMLTLIVQGAADPGAVYAQVLRLAGQADPGGNGDTWRPVQPGNLRALWPPRNFMLEARARCAGGFLPWWAVRVLAETLLAKVVIARGKPVGGFDPQHYAAEIASNTDFCRHDQTLCFVIDCALEQIDAIAAYVADCAAAQGFRFGMDVADTALMTCLVTSATDGQHVHFVDGGNGGYTNASKKLKAAARGAPRAAPAQSPLTSRS